MSDNNLAIKIYELETDRKFLEEKIERMEANLDSHVQVTYEIKERLDKLDGFLPHMSDTLKILVEDQKAIKESLASKDLRDLKKELGDAEKDTELRTKFKVLWKVLIFLGTTIAGVAVYYFQKHYL